MANHAYVVPKGKMPIVEQINKDAQEIVRRKFPQFVLDFYPPEEIGEGGINWHLHAEPYDGYLGLIFWLDKYGNSKTPCIEFRHGHAYGFLWWVEHEIREELACLYDAYSVDDAINELEAPDKSRYDTYRDYLVAGQWDKVNADQGWKEFINKNLELERKLLPDQFKQLIGSNIE